LQIGAVAETLSREEIGYLFPEPEFVEAAGVLEMINEPPEQLHEYSARLKLRLDEAARLDYARNEGRKEGRQEGRQEGEQKGRLEGEIIGRIAILQELLGVAEPTRSELLKYDSSQLNELVERLKFQLRARGQ
jgi:flagellar biosynthesis/type III secretory pathway protein FliH